MQRGLQPPHTHQLGPVRSRPLRPRQASAAPQPTRLQTGAHWCVTPPLDLAELAPDRPVPAACGGASTSQCVDPLSFLVLRHRFASRCSPAERLLVGRIKTGNGTTNGPRLQEMRRLPRAGVVALAATVPEVSLSNRGVRPPAAAHGGPRARDGTGRRARPRVQRTPMTRDSGSCPSPVQRLIPCAHERFHVEHRPSPLAA